MVNITKSDVTYFNVTQQANNSYDISLWDYNSEDVYFVVHRYVTKFHFFIIILEI